MYVHLPIYVPEPWLQKSQNGRYGAAVEHVDWSVGAILAELEKQGLAENTLVLFTSDNGSRARDEGGSNAPCRGTKATCWEGGQRVPLIAWWPGTVPAGETRSGWASAMDFLPTFARLAGASVPAGRAIDGQDLSHTLRTPGADAQRGEPFFYFHHGCLHAVREGDWKLHLARRGTEKNELLEVKELYHLRDDVGETRDRAGENPEVVARLEKLAEAARNELGDRFHGIEGTGRRPQGEVRPNQPLTRFDPAHPYFAVEYDLHERG
jgi:arylsulfatase A-like enzyme